MLSIPSQYINHFNIIFSTYLRVSWRKSRTPLQRWGKRQRTWNRNLKTAMVQRLDTETMGVRGRGVNRLFRDAFSGLNGVLYI